MNDESGYFDEKEKMNDVDRGDGQFSTDFVLFAFPLHFIPLHHIIVQWMIN
jgi:hypothetical protein